MKQLHSPVPNMSAIDHMGKPSGRIQTATNRNLKQRMEEEEEEEITLCA